MIPGILCMLAAQAGAALAAWAAARRVPVDRVEERVLVFLGFRLALVSAAVLASGACGLLRPLPLGLAGIALFAGLAWQGELRHVPRRLRRPDGVPFLVLLAPAFFAARQLLQVWIFAPFEADVLSYHLPQMADWIRTGRIPGELGNDPRAWFPAGFQLVEASWTVFLRHDVLIEAAGLEFLLLLFAALLVLARNHGLPPAPAWIAALLGTATPAALFQSVSCLNDLPAAAGIVATAALLHGRAPWPVIALLAGLSVGLKPSAAFVAPGLALLAWLRRREPRPALSRPAAAACLSAGLLLAGIWYARNLAVHGNPVYPLGTSAIADTFGEEGQRLGPSARSLAANLSTLVNERISGSRRPYQPLTPLSTGWGIGLVALGLPALVWALLARPALRPLAAAFATGLLCVLSLVLPDPYNSRFILFFSALPALAAGFLVDRLPAFRWPALAALAVVFSTTMVPMVPWWPDVRDHYLAQSWRTRSAVLAHVPPPAPPRVAIWGTAPMITYPLYLPDFSVEVVHLKARDARTLADEARRREVRVLYIPDDRIGRADLDVLEEAVRSGRMRRLSPSAFEFLDGP